MHMEDAEIMELYHARDERGIAETKKKYGKQIYAIAYRILTNREDAEECENDTYLGAWNAIPPQHPKSFPAFLCRLARNISVSQARMRSADKRGGGEVALSLEELSECIPDHEREYDAADLARILDRFLARLGADERAVFLCRYWACMPVAEIARRFGFGQSKVKMMLSRTKAKLREHLRKEGYVYE